MTYDSDLSPSNIGDPSDRPDRSDRKVPIVILFSEARLIRFNATPGGSDSR